MRHTAIRYIPVKSTPVRCTPVRETPKRHAHAMHGHKIHAHKRHAREIHAHEIYTCERCAGASAKTCLANSLTPEFASEIARLIHSALRHSRTGCHRRDSLLYFYGPKRILLRLW